MEFQVGAKLIGIVNFKVNAVSILLNPDAEGSTGNDLVGRKMVGRDTQHLL